MLPSFITVNLLLCQVGQLRSITCGEELKALQAEHLPGGLTVVDMADWQIIPAENLIAAFQVLALAAVETCTPCCYAPHAHVHLSLRGNVTEQQPLLA